MKTTDLAAALRCIANAGVGMHEAAALATIAASKDVTYDDLTEKLGIPRQSAKVRAQVLRKKGLVVTIFRPDGVPITRLTQKGRTLFDSATNPNPTNQ
jgi:DNA-binding MarR family transcriptional regulator